MGRNGGGWFVISLIMSPLLSFLLLMALGPRKPGPSWHTNLNTGQRYAIALLVLVVLVGMVGSISNVAHNVSSSSAAATAQSYSRR